MRFSLFPESMTSGSRTKYLGFGWSRATFRSCAKLRKRLEPPSTPLVVINSFRSVRHAGWLPDVPSTESVCELYITPYCDIQPLEPLWSLASMPRTFYFSDQHPSQHVKQATNQPEVELHRTLGGSREGDPRMCHGKLSPVECVAARRSPGTVKSPFVEARNFVVICSVMFSTMEPWSVFLELNPNEHQVERPLSELHFYISFLLSPERNSESYLTAEFLPGEVHLK